MVNIPKRMSDMLLAICQLSLQIQVLAQDVLLRKPVVAPRSRVAVPGFDREPFDRLMAGKPWALMLNAVGVLDKRSTKFADDGL